MNKKNCSALLLLILPLMMVLVCLCLIEARGPFWLGKNWDPSYGYLLNSLNLARLKGVGLREHPGTPVQSTGAIVLRTVHCLRFFANGSLQADVLTNPEIYMAMLNKFYLLLNTLTLFILGLVTFKFTKDLMISFLVQFSPFFSGTILLFGLADVRPEAFLLVSSLIFLVLLVFYVHNFQEENTIYHIPCIPKLSPHSLFTFCFSIVSGFGMASKVTFFPLLIIPLLILPKYKYKIFYVLGTILSFIFFTLPIVHEYGVLYNWLRGLVIHSGSHGRGSLAFIDPSLYVANFKHIVLHNAPFSIVLLLSLSILMVSFCLPRFRKISKGNINFKILSGVSLSQLVGLLMVAKHYRPWEIYYLLPALCMSGMTLLLITLCLRDIGQNLKMEEKGGSLRAKIGQSIFKMNGSWVINLLIISIICYARIDEVRMYYSKYSEMKTESLKVYAQVEHDYKDYAKIYTLNSSSPAFALGWSDILLAKKYNSEFLRKLYEDAYIFFPFEGKFYGVEGGFHDWVDNVQFVDIQSKYGQKIIFQGVNLKKLAANSGIDFTDLMKPGEGLSFIDVFKGENQTIYELELSLKNGINGGAL
ncbi:hypothetical protein ACFL27_03690 [candidate division CSSED10-310 bacterium]|uniref:Glycosyltransferase RgtA/B/C/D-like domain-containing protein n=1 Tax=candidate division CSSED10-310 bacterium TaxID=2855610 RepID=A0ABV6YSX6_UNCC1